MFQFFNAARSIPIIVLITVEHSLASCFTTFTFFKYLEVNFLIISDRRKHYIPMSDDTACNANHKKIRYHIYRLFITHLNMIINNYVLGTFTSGNLQVHFCIHFLFLSVKRVHIFGTCSRLIKQLTTYYINLEQHVTLVVQ